MYNIKPFNQDYEITVVDTDWLTISSASTGTIASGTECREVSTECVAMEVPVSGYSMKVDFHVDLASAEDKSVGEKVGTIVVKTGQTGKEFDSKILIVVTLQLIGGEFAPSHTWYRISTTETDSVLRYGGANTLSIQARDQNGNPTTNIGGQQLAAVASWELVTEFNGNCSGYAPDEYPECPAGLSCSRGLVSQMDYSNGVWSESLNLPTNGTYLFKVWIGLYETNAQGEFVGLSENYEERVEIHSYITNYDLEEDRIDPTSIKYEDGTYFDCIDDSDAFRNNVDVGGFLRSAKGECKACSSATSQCSDEGYRCVAWQAAECKANAHPTANGRKCECDYGYGGDVNACFPCEAGYFSSASTNGCQQCGLGEFQSDVGQTKCNPCESGAVRADIGGTSCTTCLPGTSANNVTNTCDECVAGSFQDMAGQAGPCLPCPTGFVSGTKASGCTPCNPGEYRDVATWQCVSCGLSQANDQSAQDTCTPCPAGSFTESVGATVCEEAQPGFYQAGNTQVACPDGQYQDEKGQTTCKVCNSLMEEPNAAKTGCQACDAGAAYVFAEDRNTTRQCSRCDSKWRNTQAVAIKDASGQVVDYECGCKPEYFWFDAWKGDATHFFGEGDNNNLGPCYACLPGGFCNGWKYEKIMPRVGFQRVLLDRGDNVVVDGVQDTPQRRVLEETTLLGKPVDNFLACRSESSCPGIDLKQITSYSDLDQILAEIQRYNNAIDEMGCRECANGFTGPLCFKCQLGYTRTGVSQCTACPDQEVVGVIMILAMLIAIAGTIYIIRRTILNSSLESDEPDAKLTMTKIGINAHLGEDFDD